MTYIKSVFIDRLKTAHNYGKNCLNVFKPILEVLSFFDECVLDEET